MPNWSVHVQLRHSRRILWKRRRKGSTTKWPIMCRLRWWTHEAREGTVHEKNMKWNGWQWLLRCPITRTTLNYRRIPPSRSLILPGRSVVFSLRLVDREWRITAKSRESENRFCLIGELHYHGVRVRVKVMVRIRISFRCGWVLDNYAENYRQPEFCTHARWIPAGMRTKKYPREWREREQMCGDAAVAKRRFSISQRSFLFSCFFSHTSCEQLTVLLHCDISLKYAAFT